MLRLALLITVVAACKQDKGPPCPQIVDHMLEVTKQQLPGHDDQMLGDRKQMIAECEKRNLSPAMRKCLMAAKTLAALGECRAKDAPRPPAPPPSGSAAPTPSGSAAPAPAPGSGG